MKSPRLHIVAHNGAPVWGGGEMALCTLLAGLGARGHRVKLYCNRDLVAQRAREYGIEVERSPLGGDIALHHAFRFARTLRRDKPDVLIVGTFRKLLLATLAGRMARVPLIVSRIGLSSDHPRNLKYRWAFRLGVDRVVAIAQEIRELYENAIPGYGARVAHIPKGIGLTRPSRTREDVRSEFGIPRGAPTVGGVGRLVVQKRFDRLLRVVAHLPANTHCLIVGGGGLQEQLNSLATELQLEGRVHLTGQRSDVPDLLQVMDVMIVTSDKEGLANVMLEAMAAGVPVVSTPVSGAEETLLPHPGKPGPGVVTSFQPKEIAAKVEALLANPELRAAMGEAGRSRIASDFTPERMLDRWEEVLTVPSPMSSSATLDPQPKL